MGRSAAVASSWRSTRAWLLRGRFPGLPQTSLNSIGLGFLPRVAMVDFNQFYIGGLVLLSIGGNEYRGNKNLCTRTHFARDDAEIHPPGGAWGLLGTGDLTACIPFDTVFP